MPWNAAFPQPNDLVSQAPTPFQNNWAFLATNIGTDHYFNSGGTSEGHHRYSQYVDQAGDPALAAGCSGVVYVKDNTTAGTKQLFYRNASNVRQIPLFQTVQYTFGAPGNNIPVYNFAGQLSPAMGGIYIYNVGGSSYGHAIYYWNGSTLRVSELVLSGNITDIDGNTTNLTVSSTIAGNFNIMISNFYP